jgi:DNA-binding PadR family transcriptional regulator
MPSRAKTPDQHASAPSILEVFILSLLDRGFETPYDLQRRGGLSLGSTIPALRRLEGAGLIRKTETVGASQRPRNGYQLSAVGRKLARTGWIPLLKDPPPTDLDAILRLADLASHYRAKAVEITSLFERAARERAVLSKRASAGKAKGGVSSLLYVVTRNGWDSGRLAAEAKFLAGLAKSVMPGDTGKPNRGLRPHAGGASR